MSSLGNDERLVCNVDTDALRFHYAHHPESRWEVRLVDELRDQRGTTWTLVERPLTEEEASALLDSHLSAMWRPREFELDRSMDVVAIVAWMCIGFAIGGLVFSML